MLDIHTKHIQKNDKAPWIKLICRLITRRQTIVFDEFRTKKGFIEISRRKIDMNNTKTFSQKN